METPEARPSTRTSAVASFSSASRQTRTTINDVTIADGKVTDDTGAGIETGASTLTLNRVQVTGNAIETTGVGPEGAGIRTSSSSDSLILNQSTVSGNTITGVGGQAAGIKANGPLTLNRSTVSGNDANQAGTGFVGGVAGALSSGIPMTIVNSTISGNSSGGSGAGGVLSGGGTATILNSTIAGNGTAGDGGGLSGTSVTIRNTIIEGNSAAGSGNDCTLFATPAADHSIDTDDSGCFLDPDPSQSNQVGVPFASVALGALAANGGPTLTRALGAGSVAIGAGDDTRCATSPVSGVDQRGVTRPQGVACDIGAFEVEEVAPPPPPPPPPAGTGPTGTGPAGTGPGGAAVTPTPNPACKRLHRKLKKAKTKAKKRKLRKKLRKLGC